MRPLSRPALSRRLSPSLLMAIVLLAGACGPGVGDALDGSASTGPGAVESSVPNVTTDPAAPDPQPAGVTADGRIVVSHLDVGQARFELNGAMERWAAAGPASYGLALTLSCECDQLSAESVVVDGASISSSFAFDVEAGFTPVVPVTVEELFAIADGFVSRLEQNPEAVAKGECDGATLALELDAVSGFPHRVSDDTPCDGGMAWSATLDLMTETAPDRPNPEGFEPVSLDQPEIVFAAIRSSNEERWSGSRPAAGSTKPTTGTPSSTASASEE